MSLDAALEDPRPATGPDFSDAVTFAFGDPVSQLFGVARVGLADGAASGLAIVFAGSEPVAASAEGAATVTAAGWAGARAGGVSTTVAEPLQRWTVAYAGEDAAFDLTFEARGLAARLAPDHPVAQTGGMEGYEQVCTVTGTLRAGQQTHELACLGQRGHLWGTPDWKRIVLARTVTAWLGDERALTLTAVRPAKAKGHGDEAIAAWVMSGDETAAVADPRLTTTYDGSLRQRRAGLELWMTEDGFVRRAAGEALCGTTLDLGRLRLDASFFQWRMEGRTGVGRYDVLRRADDGR